MSVLTVRSHKRYAVRLPIELGRSGARPVSGLLIELSSAGARISNLGRCKLAEGDDVTIRTDCGIELPGKVRWAHDGLAGIRLTRALHAPQIHAVLDAQGESEARYGT